MVACVACIVSICSDSACSFSASSPPSRTLIILAESDTKATVTPKTARHSRYSQHNKPASHCIKLVMRPWTRVSTTIIPAARSRIHLQVTSARRLMVVSKMTNPIPCPLLKCCAYSISLKTREAPVSYLHAPFAIFKPIHICRYHHWKCCKRMQGLSNWLRPAILHSK